MNIKTSKLAKSKRTNVSTHTQQTQSSQDTAEKLNCTPPALHLDDNVCRVCLNSIGTVAIFDGYGTDDKFRYCTQLEVTEFDGLPNKLCQLCTEHLRIAYDFRFQASYAEKYLRKAVFLPVLKKEVDIEQDEGNKNKKLSKQSEVASIELAENMQEIDQLLSTEDKVEEYQEAVLEISDERNTLRDVNDSESDGLSDHFSDGFSPEHHNYHRRTLEKKYENYAENRITEEPVNSDQFLVNSNDGLKNDSISELTFDYYTSGKETHSPVQSDIVTEKLCSTVENSKMKEKRLKMLKLVQLQSKEKIECNICGTNFTHINSLKQHLMKHSGEKPFKCEFCGKCFARKTILTIHRRLHTGDRPYRCDECIRKFVTKEALSRHKEREHCDQSEETTAKNKASFICTICKKTRCSKYSLAAHMRIHDTNKDQKLDTKKVKSTEQKGATVQAQEKLRRPRACVDAKNKCSKNLKYCKMCQKGFSNKWELVAHQNKHETNLTFECVVCRHTFEKKYQLLYHLQTHDNGEELLKNYVESNLSATVTKQDEVEENDAILEKCKQERFARIAIRRSKRVKSVQANVVIDGNDVKEKKGRTSEMTHKKEGKQKFCLANKFKSVNQATRIMSNGLNKCRVPRENLQFFRNELRCKLCKRSFTHSISLKVHMMKHSGDRPFHCDICGKSFSRRNVLNIHKRIHTGEKPYKCLLCENAFVTKKALLCHVTISHDETVINDRSELTCETCHAVLPNRSVLDNHMHYLTEETQSLNTSKVREQCMQETLPLFKCNLCGVSFHGLSGYSCHLDIHEPTRRFQCDICKIEFEEMFKLHFHMQQHKVEKEVCKKCGEVFTIKEKLIRHVKTKHFDARCLDFHCAECGIGLYDIRDVKEHLYEIHDVSMQGVNNCDVCRLDLKSGQEYYSHIYECHDDINKACTECGVSFGSRKNFDEHLFSHYIA